MNRIKELRLSKAIKQADLAKYLGVVQATLSHWENGKFDVDNESLQKLADYFNVTTDYILGRTDDHAPPDAKKEAPTALSTVEALKIIAEEAFGPNPTPEQMKRLALAVRIAIEQERESAE